MSSFDFRDFLLHGSLGFHGPIDIRQQSIRAGRVYGQAPLLGPRTSAFQCGELAENLQIPRRSPHKREKFLIVVAVAAVTAGAAVIAAAAATAAATAAGDATKIGPLGGDRWCRGVVFRTLPAPALGSAAGTSRVMDGTGVHTFVMSRSDSSGLELEDSPQTPGDVRVCLGRRLRCGGCC